MTHTIARILLGIALIALVSSCGDDSGSGDSIQKNKDNQISSIPASSSQWTYYSLERNVQVGTSQFGDSIADAQWAARNDWDIAISGDLIRTNSGASGNGQGGIIEIDANYDSYNDIPATGYETDTYE